MKYVKYVSVLVIVLIIGFWVLLNTMVTFIPVGKVGVLTREYALTGKRGVVDKDYGPGWHLDLGPLHSWTKFDSTIQTFEMTRNEAYGDRKG